MLTRHFSPFIDAARLSRLGRGAVRAGFAAVLVAAGTAAPMAFAQVASGTTGIDASGNAKNEMAACASGNTQEDKATCMKEVRNANAAKRAGKLGNDGDFSANALMRCNVFKSADDQSACKARVMNDANAQGSVAGGGVLREATTIVQ